jgi:excisionase family DNA binding protein
MPEKSDGDDEQERLKGDFRARRLLELFQELSEDRKEALMTRLEKEAYSPEEVAVMLSKPVGTIRRWLRAGEIRAEKLGRSWIIPKKEIARILKVGTGQSDSSVEDLNRRIGEDPLVEYMRRKGIPLTRENYIRLNFDSPKDVIESELPEMFQLEPGEVSKERPRKKK